MFGDVSWSHFGNGFTRAPRFQAQQQPPPVAPSDRTRSISSQGHGGWRPGRRKTFRHRPPSPPMSSPLPWFQTRSLQPVSSDSGSCVVAASVDINPVGAKSQLYMTKLLMKWLYKFYGLPVFQGFVVNRIWFVISGYFMLRHVYTLYIIYSLK